MVHTRKENSAGGSKMTRAGKTCLLPIALILAVTLGGCNPTPNTTPLAGPTIQFKLTNLLGVWPPYDGGFSVQTGLYGVPTPPNTQTLTIIGMSDQSIEQQPLFYLDPGTDTPNFDVRMGIVPGDASGVTELRVDIDFVTNCGRTTTYNKHITTVDQGTSGGPPLNHPFFLFELSTDQTKALGCGNNESAPGSGSYTIGVNAWSGKGPSTTNIFYIVAGNGPLDFNTQ